MASDTILKQLWEIAQLNSTEKIYYDDFCINLRNSLKLDKDEYDRALPIILHQAESNPAAFGYMRNGTFVFSTEFISKAITTIQYENQLIQGTSEYNQRMDNETATENLANIVLTAAIVNKMLDNYDQLSREEKDLIIDNLHNFAYPEQKKFIEINEKIAKELSNNESLSEDEKKQAKINSKTSKASIDILEAIKNGEDKLAIQMFKENFSFYKEGYEQYAKENHVDIKHVDNIEMIKEIVLNIEQLNANNNRNLQDKVKLYEYQKNNDKKGILEVLKSPELFQLYKEKAESIGKKVDNIDTLETWTIEELKSIEVKVEKKRINQHVNHQRNSYQENKKHIQEVTAGMNEFLLEDRKNSKMKTEIEKIPMALAKVGFSQKDIKEALTQYKNILTSLDIQEMQNKDNDGIIDSLYEKTDEMELSENTEKILGILLPLTYGNKENAFSLQEILGDERNRTEFFQELDGAIDKKIQTNISLQLEGELEDAVTQYMEENGKELDVTPKETENLISTTEFEEAQKAGTIQFEDMEIEMESARTKKDDLPQQEGNTVEETVFVTPLSLAMIKAKVLAARESVVKKVAMGAKNKMQEYRRLEGRDPNTTISGQESQFEEKE